MGINGDTLLAFATWVCLRRVLRESAIIHENVKGFDVAILRKWLGDIYLVETLLLNVEELGLPEVRIRRITILLLKEGVQRSRPWNDAFVQPVFRDCHLHFSAIMLASPEEIRRDIAQAARRESTVGKSVHAADKDCRGHPAIQDLSCTELKLLRTYRRIAPGCVYMMSQDPVKMPNFSSPFRLQTQTHSQGMMLVDRAHRWLLGSELLALQGFPMFPAMRLPRTLCSFDVDRVSIGLSARDSSTMIQQSGNSMPIPLIAVPLWYVLGFTSVGSSSAEQSVQPPRPSAEL